MADLKEKKIVCR